MCVIDGNSSWGDVGGATACCQIFVTIELEPSTIIISEILPNNGFKKILPFTMNKFLSQNTVKLALNLEQMRAKSFSFGNKFLF